MGLMRVEMNDGVGLAVEVTGTGPGLVLVHGYGGAKEDWSDHVADLARDHTVVVFDHRGHGESDQPDDQAAYSIDRLAADTLAVADAVGLASFRLLGHSMGGMVARRVVLAHPERVDALVLMDTAPGPVPGIDPDVMDLAKEILLTQGKDVFKPLMDAAAVLDTPAHLRLVAERPGYKEFSDGKWDALSGVMYAVLGAEIGRVPDELDRMASITCPTLVIVGELDELFLPGAHAMAETIPGARLVVIPDAGHSPQFENGPAWSAAMHEFLASLGKAAA